MKWLFWRFAPEVLLGLAILHTGGCEPNHDVAAGPPVVVSFLVIDNATGAPQELTSDAGPVEISGFAHLTALFDRLLDGAAVTDVDATGIDLGTDVTKVTVTPALPASATAPSFVSVYTPNGGSSDSMHLFFPPGPSITTTANPTFPSGSTITATLDKTRVRSKKGEPYTGEGQLTFHTLPFATASFAVPVGMVDPDAGAPDPDAGPPPVSPMMQPVTISFTNIPGDAIASHVTVTAGGLPFTDFTVGVADGGNPTIYNVTPTTAWPASSTISVTVDATAADVFGAVTGQATTSDSFTTSGM